MIEEKEKMVPDNQVIPDGIKDSYYAVPTSQFLRAILVS